MNNSEDPHVRTRDPSYMESQVYSRARTRVSEFVGYIFIPANFNFS